MAKSNIIQSVKGKEFVKSLSGVGKISPNNLGDSSRVGKVSPQASKETSKTTNTSKKEIDS